MNYHVARNGNQIGTLTARDISQKLASGELSGDDLVWAEGMPEWQPVRSIPGFAVSHVPALPTAYRPGPYAAPRSGPSAELASPILRLGAVMVDLLLLALGGGLLSLGLPGKDGQSSSFGGIMMGLAGLYWVGLLVYDLVRLSTHGQTLGKQIVGIRIARVEDDSNPGFVNAVLLRSFVNGIITSVPLLGGIYAIVDCCFVFRQDHRCIHDIIANTHVLKC